MKILRSICVCTSSSRRPMTDYGFRLKFVSIISSYNIRSIWIFQTLAKRLKPAGSPPVTRYAFTHPDLPSGFGRVHIVAKDSYILQCIRHLLNDTFKKKRQKQFRRKRVAYNVREENAVSSSWHIRKIRAANGRV